MPNIEYIFDLKNGPKLSLINADAQTTSSLYIDGSGRLAISSSNPTATVASASYAVSASYALSYSGTSW